MSEFKYIETTWVLRQKVKKKEGHKYEYFAIRLPDAILEKLGSEVFAEGAVAVWRKIDAKDSIVDAELTIIPLVEAKKKGIVVVVG